MRGGATDGEWWNDIKKLKHTAFLPHSQLLAPKDFLKLALRRVLFHTFLDFIASFFHPYVSLFFFSAELCTFKVRPRRAKGLCFAFLYSTTVPAVGGGRDRACSE